MGSLLQEILLALLVCFVHGQSKDGYTDENRPYEFGFMIDGEQHRHEKKANMQEATKYRSFEKHHKSSRKENYPNYLSERIDRRKQNEKGIIMGEFGFITADGIYHVTVYATDENGSFKILKMTNIKVGFPPGKATTTTTPAPKQQLQLNGFRGCSGCLIPDVSKPVPGAKPSGGTVPLRTGETNRESKPKSDPRIQPFSLSTTPANRLGNNDYSQPIVTPASRVGINEYNKPAATPSKSVGGISEMLNNLGTPYIKPAKNANKNFNNQGRGEYLTPIKENPKSNLIPDKVNPSDLSGKSQFSEMEMRILDYMARLYKFNYTLSYHGHEETGDIGGNKNGSYFSNGRDSYQRKVVYIANEFGYQPKVTLVKLDAESTPNEQTEKELTQLKGNEFIWFYKKK